MAGANTVLLNDGSVQAAVRRGASGALSSNSEGRSAAPSARSGSLDDVDGGPDGGGYIHIRRIEQVRVGRPFQWRRGAPRIALVTFFDVGKDLGLVDRFALRLVFGGAAARSHLRSGGNEYLHVGIRTDDGADIAPVEHGAGRLRGEVALEGE